MADSITYEITRLASGLIRVDGEITFGDQHTRKIVLTIDPPKLIAWLFDRARGNSAGKSVILGRAVALSVLKDPAEEEAWRT